MTQAGSRRPLAVESRVVSQANACRFAVHKTTPAPVYLRAIRSFPCQYHSTNAPTHPVINLLQLPEGQTGETWEPYKKQCSSCKREHGIKEVISHCLVLPSGTFPSHPSSKCTFEAIHNLESSCCKKKEDLQ